MININLYNNGVEIKGHAVRHICSEVSILTWYLANTLSTQGIDTKYYTSALDNKDNPNEGLSYLIIDIDNKESIWQLNNYKHNIKMWAKEMWEEDVKINDIDNSLER